MGVALGGGNVRALGLAGILLAAETIVAAPERHPVHETARQVRVSLILPGMVGAWFLFGSQDLAGVWIRIPIFLIVLIEEVLGRWLFYEMKNLRVL
jgi:hypothetical protein